ncbi:KamA family radical SAM protein [Haliangium ochraceum]|uniref:Radical SAM domain-containing protein n=1 Tax=Haliangium ochraceum (strain DSM 14365 / JCM 11303 / SMP-2) TaxID=502025 RepID=D0LLD8_HALO1|nr:lysine 2,3-aminomutase [Haliangium ochraceum]ACY18634.1 radical SAM domain-containing protein [Haliangium ochraceum DSM 14365]
MNISNKSIHSDQARKFRVITSKHLGQLDHLSFLSTETRQQLKAVASVFPFRVNEYVVNHLIDWSKVPDDPMFQLTFPQPGMLTDDDMAHMLDLIRRDEPEETITRAAQRIQMRLNPHPAGQMALNVPRVNGKVVRGVQHKYRETVLFFPSQGQTCHSYCTYCFRWAQFISNDELKFAAQEVEPLLAYLKEHPGISDVLFTGGDPMVMKTPVLRRYIEPLLAADLPHVSTIRIGTKAPVYWPYRFTDGNDADELLRLFEEIVARGKHLAVLVHFSHYREVEAPEVQTALARIRATGAVIRCQAPLIRHVNDTPEVWTRMWHSQVKQGAIPYYMFVERDTGPNEYFKVPLHRALDIFQAARKQLSGLSRTVRGPVMSCTPGKVLVNGTVDLGGRLAFVLKFLQARDPAHIDEIFFAKYDEQAAWFDELEQISLATPAALHSTRPPRSHSSVAAAYARRGR